MSNPPGTKEDVLSLLDSLGETPVPESAPDNVQIDQPPASENEKELLGFLDDLAKETSRSQTPRPAQRTSRDAPRNLPPKKLVEKPGEQAPTGAGSDAGAGGGWLGGL